VASLSTITAACSTELTAGLVERVPAKVVDAAPEVDEQRVAAVDAGEPRGPLTLGQESERHRRSSVGQAAVAFEFRPSYLAIVASLDHGQGGAVSVTSERISKRFEPG
jgi:hypothetical protein